MIIEFIKPSYEILTPLDRGETLKLIERYGRTCYKSEDKITEDSAAKFVEMIVKNGHLSVIEHINMTVKFITDRGVSHELVRHRLASYSQESTRYCNYQNKMTFVIPSWCDAIVEVQVEYKRGAPMLLDGVKASSKDRRLYAAIEEAALAYLTLISTPNPLRPEQARAILPNCLKTEIVMTANLREWRHIFDLRCSPKAHPDMRALMVPLRDAMQKLLPEVFSAV